MGRVEQRQIEQRCHSALGCRRVPRPDRLVDAIRNRIACQLMVALLENRGPGYCRPIPLISDATNALPLARSAAWKF